MTSVAYSDGDVEYGDEFKDSTVHFSEKSIRLAFIRKVYSILAVQLIITFGFVAVFVLVDDVKSWTYRNPGVFYGALAVSVVMVIALSCCESVRRNSPTNFICLFVFTVAEGFLIGVVASTYSADSVLLAVGVTAVVCISLTLFAFQTKIDFTGWGSALFAFLIVFFVFGLLLIFLPRDRFPIWHTVYAALGTLLFCFYLVYDTQLMIGGRHKYAISPEEYIFAALNLYLDVINIFLYILALLGDN